MRDPERSFNTWEDAVEYQNRTPKATALLRWHLSELRALYQRLEPTHVGRDTIAAKIAKLEKDLQ